MDSTLSKEQHDHSIRIKYRRSVLSIPLVMGLVFTLWGFYNWSTTGYGLDWGSLLEFRNWPIFFGVFYLINYTYMKVLGFLLLNQLFLKRVDIFGKKVFWDEVIVCKKYSKDFILKTASKDFYISSGLIDPESLDFLLRYIKERGIEIEE